MSGHDPVARNLLAVHPEVAATMRHQLVDLVKRAGIEEELDPLSGGQLPGIVLALAAGFASTELGAALVVRQNLAFVHALVDLATTLRLERLRLLPVRQELREPDIGERVVEQHVDDLRRACADVGA